MTTEEAKNPEATFRFVPKSEADPKLRLVISCDQDQTDLIERLQEVKGYKCFEETEDKLDILYQNQESILKVLAEIKHVFPSLYEQAGLDEKTRLIEQQQQEKLKDREFSDQSYILSDPLERSEKEVAGAYNCVYEVKLSEQEAQKLNLNSTNVFHKLQTDLVDSIAAEYQAVAAALYRLFLGPDRAPATHVVYDAKGVRNGTFSAAFEHWQPLSQHIAEEANKNKKVMQSGFPKEGDPNANYNISRFYPKDIVEKLVQDGLVEAYVVSYFLANVDAHFDNVGYNDNKICIIDFDRALWPLQKNIHPNQASTDDASSDPKSLAEDRLPIESFHIGGSFVELCGDDPFAWFDRNLFSHSNQTPDYDRHDALAEGVKKSPEYEEKLFFAFLKIILTPVEAIESCITPFIKKQKHQDAIYDYITTRQAMFKTACFDNDDFGNWLLDKDESIKAGLIENFKNYYKNTGEECGQDISGKLNVIERNFDGFIAELEAEFEDENSEESSGSEKYVDLESSSENVSVDMFSIDDSDEFVEQKETQMPDIIAHTIFGPTSNAKGNSSKQVDDKFDNKPPQP